MNLEQLKKNVGQRVRIRPMARRFDENGRELEQLDDEWVVSAVTDAGVTLSNERTGHQPILGRDHIYSYASDGERGGIKRGFLTLHVQLFLRAFLAEKEPTPRPGEAALTVPPTMRRPLNAVASFAQQAVFEQASHAYATSPQGIQEADAEFERLIAEFGRVVDQLRASARPGEFVVRRHGAYFVVGALTYGISGQWSRSMITLKGASLRLSIWDRHPPFPGTYSISGEPRQLQRFAYTYGLVPPGRPLWKKADDALAGVTSEEIVATLIDDVMRRPRRDPLHYLA
jgi:hypothetical protein